LINLTDNIEQCHSFFVIKQPNCNIKISAMKTLKIFRNVLIILFLLMSGLFQAPLAQVDSAASTLQILELKSSDYKPVVFRIGGTLGFGLNPKAGRFSTLLTNRLRSAGYGDTRQTTWGYLNIFYPKSDLLNLTPVSVYADVYIFKKWTAGLALIGPVNFEITGYHGGTYGDGFYITSSGTMIPVDLRIGFADRNQRLLFTGGPSLIYTNFVNRWWTDGKDIIFSKGFWMGFEYTLPQKKASDISFVIKMHYRWFSPTHFGGVTQIRHDNGHDYTYSISAFNERFHTFNVCFGISKNSRKNNILLN
jgi:hypothetical protein